MTRVGAMLVLLVGLAVPGLASFQAGELLYLPVAAHNEGVEGSLWRTDLTITNVDEVPIDVSIFYFSTGLFSNAAYLSRTYGLGGRADEGWAHVDEALADIPAKGTVVLEDVVATWLEQLQVGTSLGAMAIFAYEAGTLDQPDGPVYRDIIATSRTYNETTVWVEDPDNEGEFIEQAASYGQSVHAVPWYNLADPAMLGEDVNLTFYVLAGGVESDAYRYNVGLFNASDSQTAVTIRIDALKADGTQFTDDQGNAKTMLVTIPPLAHVQYNRILASVFELEDAAVATLRVSYHSWSTTSPDPNPAFACYGSVIDATTNDPTTVLPSFAYPYDVDCIWTPPEGGGGKAGRAQGRRRPLDVPNH